MFNIFVSMDATETANAIVRQMYQNDWYSQWLGIEVLDVKPGQCTLSMKVRREMLNGFAILHGGITYSIADSALAFASNSNGAKAVSIETSISHLISCKEGDQLTAVAEEQSCSAKIATYYVSIYNQAQEKVALFKGTVYRTGKEWEIF